MAKNVISTKRLQLDKANLTIVIVVSIACFVTVFSLVSAKGLFDQMSYQNRVIDKKETAKANLITSLENRDDLVDRYRDFVDKEANVIGGITSGLEDRDGDNAKIALDALPSKYDYPALASSLEKLMTVEGVSIESIAGTDDELAQSGVIGGAKPEPVEMPFTISFSGGKDAVARVLSNLDRSIRPIKIQKATITGNDAKLTVNIDAKTYYQPEKVFQVTKETVK